VVDSVVAGERTISICSVSPLITLSDHLLVRNLVDIGDLEALNVL